nr:unnamed protein product [Spirometra erinaceieuropaei]
MMFSLIRSNDILEFYLQSLAKLKGSVLALFRDYHDLIEAKLDCDSGKILSYNTQPFCNSISDALNSVDELETQLHVLESWFEMPNIQHSFYPDELDRISEDALGLIEIVQQFQTALRSVVSKQSLDSDLASGCSKQLDSTPSSASVPVHQQRSQQMLVDGGLSDFPSPSECQNSASLGTPPKQVKQCQRIEHQDQGMQQQTATATVHVPRDRPYGQDMPDLSNFGQDVTVPDSVIPQPHIQSSAVSPFTTLPSATVVNYRHGFQHQSRMAASLRGALDIAPCAADPAPPYPQTPSSHSSFGGKHEPSAAGFKDLQWPLAQENANNLANYVSFF